MPSRERSASLKRKRQEGRNGPNGIEDSFLIKGHADHRGFKPFHNNEELSDCVVEASDCRSYQCHKIVLAAASPVFRAMFRSSMTEGTSSKVQIHGASPQIVASLLRLMYGKSATVPVQSALELYMLADYYQLSRIANKIADTTADALTSDALCSILHKAYSTLSSTATFVRTLVKRAADMMPVLSTCPSFHSWELALVQQVIQEDRSDYDYAKFLAAAKWVQGDLEHRKEHWCGALLPMIKFEGFTTAHLKDIRQQQTNILQLEGVSEALFKACCNKLPNGYYADSLGYNRYRSYSPPRRRSPSRNRSRSPSGSRSRSPSRSRSMSVSASDDDSSDDSEEEAN